jgi:hypothetical protein
MSAIVEITEDWARQPLASRLTRGVVALERTECQPHVETAFRLPSTA